jgi:tetratricopeptide (TPR) repeat protein
MNLHEEGARDIRKGVAMFSRQEEGVNFILPAHGALFLKDYKKALDWFNREPDHAKHKYYGRALAYMGLGMKDKARKDLEKSAEFLPDGWERKEVMALLSKIEDGGYK